MAFEDWDVEIFDVAPRTNSQKHPITGLPIDPDGVTQSLVTMALTHRPTGKVVHRADVFSLPTADALKKYARDVITVAEANLAVQKTATAPSPLKGALAVTLPPPDDPRTPAQKDLQAFQQADADHRQTAALTENLKAIDPAEAVALDALVDKKKAVRDAAAAPVIAALKDAAALEADVHPGR